MRNKEERETQKLSRDVIDMKDNVYFDEQERNALEERLDEIYLEIVSGKTE